MSKNTPNTDKVHPRVEVSSHKGNAETTHGGRQKSESHYAKVINNAVNKDPATTYSAKRTRR